MLDYTCVFGQVLVSPGLWLLCLPYKDDNVYFLYKIIFRTLLVKFSNLGQIFSCTTEKFSKHKQLWNKSWCGCVFPLGRSFLCSAKVHFISIHWNSSLAAVNVYVTGWPLDGVIFHVTLSEQGRLSLVSEMWWLLDKI